MSMYLPNDAVGPTGAEGAEFIDPPDHEVEPADAQDADREARGPEPATDEAYGHQETPPGMETEMTTE